MANLKISVVTVCFNAETTIEDTIRSVEAQGYPNLEHIIVDGESSDGTVALLETHDKSITEWVSEPDKGIYDAMNKGIQMASGDVIAILNADDYYAHDDVLAVVMDAFEQAPAADIVYGDLDFVSARNPSRIVRAWRSGQFRSGRFKWGWHPPHPSFFVRRRAYERFGTFDLAFPIAADYELMLRFLEKERLPFVYVREVLVKMRTGGTATMSIRNMAKGQYEVWRAFGRNGLPVSRAVMVFRPATKLPQLLHPDRFRNRGCFRSQSAGDQYSYENSELL